MPLKFSHAPKILIAAFVALAITLSGCTFWHNVTAYYNTFYNAQKYYDDAVTTIEAQAQKDRDTNYFAPYVSAPDIQSKFDSVVAKCSKILQFHADSKYVDQALLLIGSSYAYTMQIDASKRELQDLITHFPQSELLNPARLLYAKVNYYGRLYDSSLAEATEVAHFAHDAAQHDVEIEALMLTSQIAIDRHDYDNAANICSTAVGIDGPDKLRGLAAFQMGAAYLAAGHKQQAADAYALVVKFHPPADLRFRARLSYAQLQADNGSYEPALATLEDIRLEETKQDNIAMVHFERGRTYDLMGDTGKAFKVFRMIDTTYKGTVAAQKAFAERGKMFENRFHDFRLALDQYSRAKNSGTSDISPMLDQKVSVYTHYFTILNNFRTYDSIITPGPYIAIADSLDSLARLKAGLSGKDSTKGKHGNGLDSSLAGGQRAPNQNDTSSTDIVRDRRRGGSRASIATNDPNADLQNRQTLDDPDIRAGRSRDSTRNGKKGGGLRDTLHGKSDSTKMVQRAPSRVITPDSARGLIVRARFELAGLFLLELNVPDSAAVLYQSVVDDTLKTSFILPSYYALAQIALIQKDTVTADSLYSLIVARYRHSEFARKIRRQRGEAQAAVEEPDTSLNRYDAAARILISGDTLKAIEAFRALVDTSDTSHTFDTSMVTARSLYAIGWIYENYRAQNDSAVFYYRIISRKYPTSAYAERVTPKLAVRDDPKSLEKYVKVNEIAAVSKTTGKKSKGSGANGKGGAGATKQELPEMDEDTQRLRSHARDITQDEKDDNQEEEPDSTDSNNN